MDRPPLVFACGAMAWDHGYFSSSPYTCGAYRELAPAWLDLAALLKGHLPPRLKEGDPFHYLELGSGMGFGLCLLAASYPEGSFTGIDFQPDHIVHSRQLASQLGLTNVRFEEADFLQLAAAPGPLAAAHHYVAAHGIATWVTPPIQQALLQLAAIALRPGGIFYCSYNTLPGWLAATTLQHLFEEQRLISGSANSGKTLQAAAATITDLLGTKETPSALAQAQPSLRAKLEKIPRLDSAYLLQEYGNEGWQPLYVAQLHRRCAAHKLRFHASATLPDNFLELLPANVQSTVLAETDPSLRQTRIDLAINQSFRRDLFLRGGAPLTPSELQRRLGAMQLRLQEAPPTDTYRFDISFGQVNGVAEIYRGVEEQLLHGPRSFDQLLEASQQSLPELAKIIALLLHNGRLGLERSSCVDFQQLRHLNGLLQELMLAGRPYSHLLAPATCSSIGFSLVEALLADGQRQQLHGQELEQHLSEGLRRLGRSLNGEPGAAVAAFLERQPRLQALGVLT